MIIVSITKSVRNVHLSFPEEVVILYSRIPEKYVSSFPLLLIGGTIMSHFPADPFLQASPSPSKLTIHSSRMPQTRCT